MGYKLGIGQKRLVLKILLAVMGLALLPGSGPVLEELLNTSIGPVQIKMVVGALALVFVYLIQKGKV